MVSDTIKIRNLKNPPIAEAIMDIRFGQSSTPTDFPALQSVVDVCSREMPHAERRSKAEARFTFDQSRVISVGHDTQEEFEFYRADNKDLLNHQRSVAVQRDGITIRHRYPYGGWEDVYKTCGLLFEQYTKIVKPVSVVRMGVRYINKINLPPHESVDLDDYFTYGPQIPEGISQVLFAFHSRIGIAASDDLKAWINLVLEDEDVRAVFLDIDVFRADIHSPDWKAIANPLEEIHLLKNQLFFGSLTEKALRAYE